VASYYSGQQSPVIGLQAADLGMIALSWDPAGTTGGAQVSAGRQLLQMIRVPTSTVTNIVYGVNTAGATLTAGQNFVGLYDFSGNLIASSADQTTPFGSTGLKTAPLSGGPYNLPSGLYFISFLANGTTMPFFDSGSANTTWLASGAITSGKFRTAQLAATGATANANPAVFVGSSQVFRTVICGLT
jgi:hypothetical protein